MALCNLNKLAIAYIPGLSVGDELGFQESLTNLEVNSRRRSVSNRNGVPGAYSNVLPQQQQQKTRMSGTVTVPPFRPLPLGAVRPMAQQSERQRLVVQHNASLASGPSAASSGTVQVVTAVKPTTMVATMPASALKQQQIAQIEAKLREQQQMQQEVLAMQVIKQQRQQQQQAMKLQQQQQQQRVQYPQQALQQATNTKRMQDTPSSASNSVVTPVRMPLPTIVAAIPPAGSIVNVDKLQLQSGMRPMSSMGSLPPFMGMPASTAQITDRISNSPTLLEDAANEVPKEEIKQLPLPSEDAASSVNKMTLMSLHPIATFENEKIQNQEKRQSPMSSLPSLAPIQGMETSLKALAEASNITLEALEAAILVKQQQLLRKQQGPSTTTSTTPAPAKKHNNSGATKVMNAPREYYPVGYDKNFDDNFASRVDLPDTTFYCGDQKHFPGLYADEDLGCMVFHVCALTDDGLIMKSFLCPESTLFDQTILKCNWWFYVDCKASKSLYDSNIPISKSYQLMKALAFFSAYKSHDNSTQHANNEADPLLNE
ncbi:hypothetical protein QAD02_014425 [Eretmocerus hayati]|uniref:Uncharacterized protein n=1 Tax=Eretmocerus hayati TaxID=131215 RepID=A0ACC2P587_9HYME|nr:hypothetical protein QAD02_014425 [Eretmocerus hayati]